MTDDPKAQIAAILALDIDTAARVAEQEWSAEELREFIFRLKEMKDQVLTDSEIRERRYNALPK